MDISYHQPTLAFLSNLGPMELLFIFLIIFLVFGAEKLPRIAKDLGKGINQFKKSLSGEIDELKDDLTADKTKKN
jgi:sec-independent protein translocase protein TatA